MEPAEGIKWVMGPFGASHSGSGFGREAETRGLGSSGHEGQGSGERKSLKLPQCGDAGRRVCAVGDAAEGWFSGVIRTLLVSDLDASGSASGPSVDEP